MNRRTRLGMIAASLLVFGAVSLRNAQAGNYTNTGARYFAYDEAVGYYFYSTGGRTILIDDITFSVNYIPCEPSHACDYFDGSDMMNVGGMEPGPIGMSVRGPEAGGYYNSQTNWGGLYGYSESVSSKSKFHEVGLVDWDGESNMQVIDVCSFATYGQLLARSWTQEKGFLVAGGHESPNPAEVFRSSWAAAAGGEGLAASFSMPMAISSLPTSQSRHYQSPYVVRNQRVYLRTTNGTTVMTARAYVKGRTLDANDANAPVIDTAFGSGME